MRRAVVRLATRGSPLALWQAEAVRERLRALEPTLEVLLHVVRTSGDRNQVSPVAGLSMTGVFTKEVDAEVLAGRVDAAVHSLKDQPTDLDPRLAMKVVLERGSVEDVIVGRKLAELGPAHRIATGSVRREAQIRRARPELAFVPIRGNVETRLKAVREGMADAVVLARAGLVRLGLEHEITEVLETGLCLPAPSQGIVGVTVRSDDEAMIERIERAVEPVASREAAAERAFLRALGGGCNVPAGALAVVTGDEVTIQARILSRDGSRMVESASAGAAAEAEALGRDLGEELLAIGGKELLREARE